MDTTTVSLIPLNTALALQANFIAGSQSTAQASLVCTTVISETVTDQKGRLRQDEYHFLYQTLQHSPSIPPVLIFQLCISKTSS